MAPKKTHGKKGIKHSKTRLELRASPKRRNKNLPEDEKLWDEHDHKTHAKKGMRSPKTPLEHQVSFEMTNKNSPEEDELLDEHDHKTVLNVNSKKFKTDDGKKGIETSKTPLKPEASSEDDEHWNENKPIPEDYVPWLEHDHDKCIAEQLGLDLDAPIPAYYAKYFDNQVPQSPDEPFILSGSELDRYSPFHTPPREVTPLSEQYQLLTEDAPFIPSRRDRTDPNLGSNDAAHDLGDQGPMTRSKRNKLLDEFYKEIEIEMASEWCKSMEAKFH